ncbi:MULTISPECIES: DUF2806 domain-containing protein [Vibrio]|uniref:DUF2806 domain-containing protein n=1 Tax=Vibrio TaxID=662 RepID=UPI001C060127|nr:MULTISPECIES: DUF2806 domain-containing protein [Vibrio]EIF2705584.1 DUF2806 domain-containing protein [Vibrio alginolyticus]MCS0138595.1 DUF2806 domain-containing protein [Vibrio alginolyticus]MDL0444951.1 DUF2806 domain-containing protein [Vibrio alginolyticus]MDW3636649.1 DUF2806 domain-containing protein [Vibrio sp. Vb0667]ULF88297.1 DUF2806 domain-containing protein [Vibrio alginolyticus]
MIGEKLLGKLWDTVAREGVGSLASPWQTRRQGKANVDARRDELLMLAQTEIDVADIKAGRKIFTEDRKLVSLEDSDSETSVLALRDGRIEPTFSLEELRDNTLNTRQARDIQEQINVTKAVLFAEEELENNYTEGSEEDLDSDWFARWRDSVEKISSEDLQRLWAKALAGELASPGSYSLRTLEFIKNISKSEAHEISKLAPFAISDSVYQVKAIEDAGLDFSYLLEMEDIGILSGVKGGGLHLTLGSRIADSYEQALFHNNKILRITHENSGKKAEFEVYKVTKLGMEVLRLGVFPMNTDYLEQIGTKVKTQGFKVIIADWVQTTKTHGQYFNAREL